MHKCIKYITLQYLVYQSEKHNDSPGFEITLSLRKRRVGGKLNRLILDNIESNFLLQAFFSNYFCFFWSFAKVVSPSIYPKFTVYTQLSPTTFFILTSQCNTL